ncbi:hypothetical protein C5O00_08585 [Pukyongia salina]|uniref:Uncharacterized protein n=1 Tax=Pukyongia salina TaxID=2094025 RepID=A0A2S0HX10_9FLAO|nr:hypothetical protein [Pukyongia salina]AVI51227.1 hypothetical protein C5O00_08585 [Pukyongia salina]
MTKKKSKQKLTEFDHLKKPSEVREYLNSNPDDYGILLESLQNRYAETFAKKQGKENEIFEMVAECYRYKDKPELETQLRNITYETNHSIITSCIHNYIIQNRCFPTIQSISNETGLSRKTIYNHLTSGLHTDFNKLVKGKLEYMASHALSKLYLIGIQEDNATALKSFIEMTGAAKHNAPTIVNNYIQINGLRITQEQIEKFPEELILRIESFMAQELNGELKK